jgi:hypothetical protein
MDKKEATQNIQDFISFNAFDIALLGIQEPLIAKAFEGVLNALSLEYGSGDNYTKKIEEIVKQQNEILTAKPIRGQEVYELKEGDRVYLPKTKSVGGMNSNVTERAKIAKQDYLFVKTIEYDVYTLNENFEEGGGDFFAAKDLVPYPNNVMVGDEITFKDGTKSTIIKIEIPYVYFEDSNNIVTSNSLELFYKVLDAGEASITKRLDLGVKNKQSEVSTQNTEPVTTQSNLYKLPIETDPEFFGYDILFEANRGDRKSPTQSASGLYKQYKGGNAEDEILAASYKGNDGLWYRLGVNKNGVGAWVKDKDKNKEAPSNNANQVIVDDYTKMSKIKLNKLLNETAAAQSAFDSNDPEWLELNDKYQKIMYEIQKRKVK